ncbi:MAG: nitrilase-related carbon-nitrogen hydrolase [Desulfobulbaceae bacterium]|nr:nitrilase-related carbon-nitrogen hydrolase [Desulfobulbaceae bacterium]
MKHLLFPRVGFLQFEIRFGELRTNLETVKRLIQRQQPGADTMVVLPELWASGFDYSNAEDHAGQTPAILEELHEIAARENIFIAGSLLEADKTSAHVLSNSLYVTGPYGVVGKFQKQHLFSLWREDEYFRPGNYCPPVETPLGQVGGLVCYDLRFPEISRSQASRGAALLLVSAQWPKVRLDHWRILLQARAIENQAFIAACNSCGTTGKIEMAGHSMVLAPDGSIMAEAGEGEEALYARIDGKVIEQARDRFCSAGERPRPVQDSEKIVFPDQLKSRLASIRRQDSTIAFTSGCFDGLRSGHVEYLEKARQTADYLVVGLNSDVSIRAKTGKFPGHDEIERARVLAALACVDFVVLFAEETPQRLIEAIMPDVLVKGTGRPEAESAGAAEVRAGGARVVHIPSAHADSTAEILQDRENPAG